MKLPRPPRTVLVAIAVVIAITLPLVGLGTAYAYSGDVPRGTSVLGIDIGAMSRQDATEAVAAGLAAHAEALAAPLDVQIGDEVIQLTPEEVGLAVDVEATVDRAANGHGNPVSTVVGALFGTREVEPVVTVDTELLEKQLREAADEAGEAMTMPAVRFEGTEPVPVYPEPGYGLDLQVAAETVTQAWPRVDSSGSWQEPEVVAIPLVDITPVSTAEDVDRLLAELARPAVAAPVTISIPDGAEITASPEAIAASLKLEADSSGEIVPEVDPKALRDALDDQLDEVESDPVNARFTLEGGGAPQIAEETDGEQVDVEALAGELLAALPQPEPRSVAATMTTVAPDVDTEQLAQLGVEEKVSSFTTYYDGGLASPRNQNIALLADMVDGALVMPGEVFSLNEFSGPRDYEQGFQDAPVIIGGRLQPAVGGGLSQFTTTLFNASFYAGLEDVEHHPHSFYYSRYPAVIEATIFYPTLDMKFRNNTDYGIVIDTSYDDAGITVTLWGTKAWDEVTAEWGDRRDPVQPRRQYVDPGPSCIDTKGIPGFTQDAWRVFHQNGEEVQREKFSWRYDAQPEVICAEDPDEAED